jgi:hypothetical protein
MNARTTQLERTLASLAAETAALPSLLHSNKAHVAALLAKAKKEKEKGDVAKERENGQKGAGQKGREKIPTGLGPRLKGKKSGGNGNGKDSFSPRHGLEEDQEGGLGVEGGAEEMRGGLRRVVKIKDVLRRELGGMDQVRNIQGTFGEDSGNIWGGFGEHSRKFTSLQF